MTAAPNGHRFRDGFQRHIPWWLSDRREEGKTVGYRVLWSLIAPLDAAMELLIQGLLSWFPGLGTPTALPWIGRGRGLIRWQDESDAAYAERLRAWRETHQGAGRTVELARQIHGYLRSHPRVRIVTRAGRWITVEADGTVSRHVAAWDWDSVSHPERSGWWSDLWIIVYPTQWALAANWGVGTWGDVSQGLGHDNAADEYDAINGLVAEWKSAHSRVRAIIWTSDGTLFDPTNPSSLPNGTWGAWGTTGDDRVPSGRNLTTCRYWEPQ